MDLIKKTKNLKTYMKIIEGNNREIIEKHLENTESKFNEIILQ